MEKISLVRKCYSCGEILQCTNENLPGYVEEALLNNPDQLFLFCNSCFEKEKFDNSRVEPELDPDFITLLEEAKKQNALIVYVLNLFSFEGSFNKQVLELIKGLNILVIGNKRDLLPSNVSNIQLRKYIIQYFENEGVKVKDVIISYENNDDTSLKILNKIYEIKGKKDVYFLGSKNCGKTTIINSCLRVYKNFTSGNIITQNYKGTNMRVMQIPMDQYSMIYDTPGLSVDNSILYNLDNSIVKEIFLTKAVKARSTRLISSSGLCLGGLAMIELIDGPLTSLNVFIDERIQLKKITGKELPNKFINLISRKKIKPRIELIQSMNDIDVYEITLADKGNKDISILGLGWISLKAKGQTLRVYVPNHVSVTSGKSKINQ